MAIEAVNTENQGGKAGFPRASVSAPIGVEAHSLRKDDFDRDVWCMLGMPVDIANIDQAVAAIDDAVRTGCKLSFVTPNVNWLARAARDKVVRRELINADLSLIDGAPLAAMARRLGLPIQSRVAGSDLFEALRRRPGYGGRKLKVFFFGGRDGAAETAAKTINAENGGVKAVGWLNPGFGDVEDMSRSELLSEINEAAPDFVVVALGAGKGQAWIDRNQDALTAPVIAHLGAVVDFTAGGIQRAPRIFRTLGLEWAWRIKEEPALWRRYAQDSIAMGAIVASRMIPQWGLNSHKASAEGAGVNAEQSAGSVRLHLNGDLRRSALRDIRVAFRQAATQATDVILDFTSVRSFDRAFLGLVLMLEKHVAKRGVKLYIRGVNKRQMKVLKANDMRYPEYTVGAVSEAMDSAQHSMSRRPSQDDKYGQGESHSRKV